MRPSGVIDHLPQTSRQDVDAVDLLRRLNDQLGRARDGSAVVLVPPGVHDRRRLGPIVCAVDASRGARRAVAVASGLAGDIGAPLVLANALPFGNDGGEPDWGGDQGDVAVRSRLSERHRVGANVRRVVGPHEIEFLRGHLGPPSLLADFARESDARLLIVAPPASETGWLSPRLVGEAGCPVALLAPR
jgi:hypothetical protein